MFNQEQRCTFCSPTSRFKPIMTTALYEKYSTSSNFYFSRQIDDLLSNSCTKEAVEFHEILFTINNYEFLKREYDLQEFTSKIQHFGEYYKFNRDIPRCFDRDLSNPLMRYQEQLKKLDFRKVKNALKKQQGISITSQHSQSSVQDTEGTPCSRYPSVLGELCIENSSDSIALNNICEVITLAYGNDKLDSAFKGNFQEKGKNFAAFLEHQRKNSLNSGKTRGFLKNDRQNRNTISGKGQNINSRTFQKKTNEKIHPNASNLKNEKLKKDKNIRVNPFQELKINEITKGLHQFSQNIHSDKYQSIKTKNFVNINKKSKQKVSHKIHKSKTANVTKTIKQEKGIIQSDRLHREESKKTTHRKNSALREPEQRKNQRMNENNNAYLGNQCHSSKQKPKQERHSKSISRSKSKIHLPKEGLSHNSSKKITRSTSNLTQNSFPKDKGPQKQKESNRMDKLLNKKLSIFLKC